MITPLTQLGFAWLWVGLGLLSGTLIGLFFHRPGWLGGYDTWPRRMVRLGHIAFFGTGLLNLFHAVTVVALKGGLAGGASGGAPGRVWTVAEPSWPATLLVIGGLTMPTVCFLAAWRKPLRQGFAVPVVCLVAGWGWATVDVLTRVWD